MESVKGLNPETSHTTRKANEVEAAEKVEAEHQAREEALWRAIELANTTDTTDEAEAEQIAKQAGLLSQAEFCRQLGQVSDQDKKPIKPKAADKRAREAAAAGEVSEWHELWNERFAGFLEELAELIEQGYRIEKKHHYTYMGERIGSVERHGIECDGRDTFKVQLKKPDGIIKQEQQEAKAKAEAEYLAEVEQAEAERAERWDVLKRSHNFWLAFESRVEDKRSKAVALLG